MVLARAVAQAARSYVESLEKRGSLTITTGPKAFEKYLEKERGRVQRTLFKAGLKLD